MNPLRRFSVGGEKRLGDPDWEVLAKRSCYEDVIGKKAEDIKPRGTPCGPLSWLRCDCGLLMMTSASLAGQGTHCAKCIEEQATAKEAALVAAEEAAAQVLRTGHHDELHESVAYQQPVMQPVTERGVSIFVIVFCLLAAGAVGHSAMTGGSRPSDHMLHLD